MHLAPGGTGVGAATISMYMCVRAHVCVCVSHVLQTSLLLGGTGVRASPICPHSEAIGSALGRTYDWRR